MEMIEKVILSLKQRFSSCFHVQMLSITDRGRTFLCSLSLITSEKKRKADDSKEMFKVRLKSYSEADLNTEQNILNTCDELSKQFQRCPRLGTIILSTTKATHCVLFL